MLVVFFKKHFYTHFLIILLLEFFIFTQIAFAIPFSPYSDSERKTFFYLSPDEIEERARLIEELIKRKEEIQKVIEPSPFALRLDSEDNVFWDKFFDTTYNLEGIKEFSNFPLGRCDYEKKFSEAIFSRVIEGWGLGEERELSIPYLFDSDSSYSISKSIWRSVSRDQEGHPLLREETFYGLPMGGALLSGDDPYSRDGRVMILAARNISIDFTSSTPPPGLSQEEFNLIKLGYETKGGNPWDTYKKLTGAAESSWDEVLLSREKERLRDEFLLDLHTPSVDFSWLGYTIAFGEEVGELSYTPAFLYELISESDYDPLRAETMASSFAYLLKEMTHGKDYSEAFIEEITASLKDEILKYGSDIALSLSASYAEVEKEARVIEDKVKQSSFILPDFSSSSLNSTSPLPQFSLTILPLRNDGTPYGPLLGCVNRGTSEVYFIDGELVREVYPDGRVAKFSYKKDRDGNIEYIYAKEGGLTRVYDGEGQLTEVRSPDGSIIEYEGDLIRRIHEAGGTITDFAYIRNQAEDILEIHLMTGDSAQEQVYDPYGNLIRITQKDGTALDYLPHPLGKYIDQFGQAHLYRVIEEDGNIRQTLLDSSGTLQVFDNEDNILSVTTSYGHRLFYTDSNLSRIEVPDIFSIRSPSFDREGYLISGEISLPGMDDITLLGNEIILPDATRFNYYGGLVSSLTTPQGVKITQIREYPDHRIHSATISFPDGRREIVEKGGISKIIEPDGTVFNLSGGKITDLLYPDGTSIFFENDLPFRIINPDGDILTIAYDRDQDGQVLSKRLISENGTVRTYDSEGNLVRVEIPGSNPLPASSLISTASINDRPILMREPGVPFEDLLADSDFVSGSFSPFELECTTSSFFSAQTIASDGTYLYVGGVDINAKDYVFRRIGTGFNGTEKGKDYGDFLRIHQDTLFDPGPLLLYSATFHSDGYIYVKSQASTTKLTRIKTFSGEVSEIDTGRLLSSSTHITSDGSYLYALSPLGSSDSPTRPVAVNIFDPQADFKLMDTYTLDIPSEDIYSISSDGVYLYAFSTEKMCTREGSVNIIDLRSRSFYGVEPFLFPGPAGREFFFSSQYDWTNNRFWLTQSKIGIKNENGHVLPFTIDPSSERRLNFTGNVLADLSLDKFSEPVSLPEARGLVQYPEEIIATIFSILENVSGLGRYAVSSLDRELGELTSFTGLIKHLADKSGNNFNYSYEISPDGEFITVLSPEDSSAPEVRGVQRFNEKGELISLTTPQGECLYFSSGNVSELITAQGIRFTDPVMSQTGSILSAKIIAPDNTIHLIEEGEIKETRAPDGTVTRYDKGFIASEQYPSGEVITRTYIRDSDGQIKEERRSDGTIITYSYTYDENGGITNIYKTDHNGKISLYDSFYNLIEITDGDIITHYNKGRVYLVTDKDDTPLIEYLYDQEGNLYEIRSAGLHSQLDERIKLSESEVTSNYNKTYESIFQEVSDRLSEIASSVGEAYVPADQLLRQVQAIWATYHGSMPGDVHDQLSRMMNEACVQRDKILSEKLNAYREVEENKLSALSTLKENKDASLLNLTRESLELRERLYIQEVLGIVPVYYASILGRSLDESEIAFWLDEFRSYGSLSASAIRDHLYALPEYNEKVVFQKGVIEGVRSWFENYITSSPEEKKVILTGYDLIARDITSQELKRLLCQLEGENIHFISSAIENLRKLFEDAGIFLEAQDIAIEALTIDILAGNISSLKPEDLKLSLYSLSRVAKRHGLELFAAHIEPGDLETLFHPAMVLIEGDHFATVREATHDKVVYYESNLGPLGKDVVVSPDQFQKLWQDKVILTKELPSAASTLSQNELLAYRGAGLFSWVKKVFETVANAVGDVFQSIGRVAAKTAEAFGDVVKGIVQTPIRIIENIKEGRWGAALLDIGLITVSFFTPITSAINNFLSATLSPVFSTIGNALKVVSTTLWNGAKTVVSAIGSGINTVIPGFTNFTSSIVGGVKTIGTSIGKGIKCIGNFLGYDKQQGFLWETAKTALDTSITVGVQESLKELKIETPIISSMISSGITGSLYYGDKKDYFNTGIITGAARGTVLELGEKLKIDPSLTNIASIVLDQALTHEFLGTGPDGIPTLMGELSCYGVRELGETLGIDDRISQLAGIPLKVTAENSLSADKNLISGLRAGFTSVLLEHIAQEEDIDPLYASLATRTLTAGLTKLFDENLAKDKTDLLNFFKGTYDGIYASTRGSLTLGRTGIPDFDMSTYQAKLFDFAQRIREDSLTSALRTSFTSTFHRHAVDDLTVSGGLIDYLNGRVNKIQITSFDNPEVDTCVAGKLFKQVKIGDSEYRYFDLSTGNLAMIGEGTYYYDSKLRLPLLRQGVYNILNEYGESVYNITINPPSLSSSINLPTLDTSSINGLWHIFGLNRRFDNRSPFLDFCLVSLDTAYPTASAGDITMPYFNEPTSEASSSNFVSPESFKSYSSGFEPDFETLSLDFFAYNDINAPAIFANMPLLTQRLHAKLVQSMAAPHETQVAGLNLTGLIPVESILEETFHSKLIEKGFIDLENDSPSAIVKDVLFSPSAISSSIFSLSPLYRLFDAVLPWIQLANPLTGLTYLTQHPDLRDTIFTTLTDQHNFITGFWGDRLYKTSTFLTSQYDLVKEGAINIASNIYREVGILKLFGDLKDNLFLTPALTLGVLASIPAAIDDFLLGPGNPAAGVARGEIGITFIGGFGNPYPKGVIPDYARNYIDDINTSTSLTAIGIAAYEDSPGKIGWTNNFFDWLNDSFGGSSGARDVMDKINTLTYNGMELSPHAVMVAYSGGRNYGHKALEMGQYGYETVIFAGPPSLEGYVTKGVINNPNTKRVITVYGENDSMPFVGNNFFEGVDNINIKIFGADHYNIFRQPDGYYSNPEGAKFNQMANNFMVRLAEASHRGEEELNGLLEWRGITKNSITGTYAIDLYKFFKEQ